MSGPRTTQARFVAEPPNGGVDWSASCGGARGSGTEKTQAAADAAKAAWVEANCFGWSASCGSASGSGTENTQAAADAAKAAWTKANCGEPTCGACESPVSGACVSDCGANEMCGGTSCICDSGYERVGGSCVAECGPGQERVGTQCLAACGTNEMRSGTSCVCDSGYERVGGSCVAKCGPGQERVGTQCLTACGTNETRSGTSCVCASGYERINGQGPCVAVCGACENRNLQGDCIWQCRVSEVCNNGVCDSPCSIPGFPCGQQTQDEAEETPSRTPRAVTAASTATAATRQAPAARASADRAAASVAAQSAPGAVAADGHLLGATGAALRIVVYENFGCPFCREFGRDVIPLLVEQYIEAGTVSLEYRHLAILGEGSVSAAAASECAADQDLFWPYHDQLVGTTVRTYKEHARALQATPDGAALDLVRFGACVDAGTHVAAVRAATAAAWSALSGSGTARIAVPLFLINGEFWRIGIPTMAELRAEITRLQDESSSGE
jgi:protein-disulfide isomerase